jgi:hypothetical protein
MLVCGFSTERLDVLASDWDVVIDPDNPRYAGTGLKAASVLRLSFLYGARESEIGGVVGALPAEDFATVRNRLASLFT